MVAGDWITFDVTELDVQHNTGFQHFSCLCGVKGLARESNTAFEVLAIESLAPGTGQFYHFLNGLQQRFDEIYFWFVWNHSLETKLKRAGFKRTRKMEGEDELRGWKWVK